MLLFNFNNAYASQFEQKFKYIQCYYSTGGSKNSRKGINHLNTSNVIIQPNTERKTISGRQNLNTSNVIIQRRC